MDKNIAVIGGGYWGKNLIRNFASLEALYIICDSNLEVLNRYYMEYYDARIEKDYLMVLREKQVKGVVIATPPITHYEMAKQAILAGKDVFIEKPMALKVEDGRELVELAEKKKRVLLIGHVLEYHPAIVKLKELVDKGDLGKIYYIYSSRLNLGKLRTEENVMWSFAPHDISVILLLMNGEMPIKVSAHSGTYLNKGIPDVTMTNMEFKNGVKAHIFVSWLHPFKEQKLVVVGDKKMAVFDDNTEDKLVVYPHEIEWVGKKPIPHAKKAEIIPVSNDEPLKLECQDFIKSMENRVKPKVDGRKGLQVLEILEISQKSLERDGQCSLLVKGVK